MKFTLTTPCDNCPFRSDIIFYLRKGRRKEIADNLRHDKTFVCHKTVDYERWRETREDDDEAHYEYQGGEIHCAGALIAMHRKGEIQGNFLLRMAIMFGWLKIENLNMSADVLDLDTWIESDNDD